MFEDADCKAVVVVSRGCCALLDARDKAKTDRRFELCTWREPDESIETSPSLILVEATIGNIDMSSWIMSRAS
jgi:hypothetical protein